MEIAMTRDDVLEVVQRHVLAALDDLSPENFDPSKSMKDLGANSLDIVEVVSRSMRELRIKVPRSELSKLTNVNELVDLLYENAVATSRTS
jgi:acyl carrier protein